MPTSTYPKEWKNQFIFVSNSLLYEPLPARDPVATIEDDVPPLFSAEKALWKLMCENPTCAFDFPEGILAMGGLSPFYPSRPKAFLGGNGESFTKSSQGFQLDSFCLCYPGICFLCSDVLVNLMQADVKGVSFVIEGIENQELGVDPRDEVPCVEGHEVEVIPGDGTPLFQGPSPKSSKGSQNSPHVKNISSVDKDLETRFSPKCNSDLAVGASEAVF
ncbi:hypothetical protein Hdeb2414_s0012g00394701 [Helianthus debilis subsp. tardiflorus]